MINYNTLLQGIYGDHLKEISELNEKYAIYNGEQEWETNSNLDYEPTKKITNYIQKLINTKARFMFGKAPFFDLRPIKIESESSDTADDLTQAKEDLLADILKKNKFHSKLLKARKDCSIGGRVALKLWAKEGEGLKIIFSPAQEFFPIYDIDDVDIMEKVIFLYALNAKDKVEDQRVKKQTWELINGECILNEGIYDGKGFLIEELYKDYKTGLDFIPVIIIQNGGLTGETSGTSDVDLIWQSQDAYNKLSSDDLDALKFNLFPQYVAVDASEGSLENMTIAPGSLIDLQSDLAQAAAGRQAKLDVLETSFDYTAKFQDTIDRIKNDMYDLLDVPNISLEHLKGIITSGKSMKALYWGLIAVCEEDATEWVPALEQMVEYIFKIISIYNLYDSRQLAEYETTLEIVRSYPIQEDIDTQKRVDMEEVVTEVRSRKSYMNKWGEYDDIDIELKQIQEEKQMLELDTYTRDLIDGAEEGE